MAELGTISSVVRRILCEVLDEPEPELAARPVLAAHEWDSMTSLEVLAQLEKELGVEVDLRVFHAVRTVDELVRLAEDLVAAR